MTLELSDALHRVLKLSPDSFTSLERTPWAGSHIADKYKSRFLRDGSPRRIGESWEFSCDPAAPSRLVDYDGSMSDIVTLMPEKVLSPRLARFEPNCQILVKLLNAATPLSLQVHPEDGDPYLAPNECGKPESWLVLDAEEGAGIYLGFKEPLSRDKLRTLIEEDADLAEFLHFVEVRPGDYFEIEPGVPHSIGAGVTLLEPQRIKAGLSGKTYRLWDWQRKYDAHGNLDPIQGSPRELHVEAGLRLVDPEVQCGDEFVATLRRKPVRTALNGGILIDAYSKTNNHYSTYLVHMSAGGSVNLEVDDGYAAVVMLSGQLLMTSKRQLSTSLSGGEPALIPHAAQPVQINASAESRVAIVTPATATVTWG